MSTISLEKGGNVSLTKIAPKLKKIFIGLALVICALTTVLVQKILAQIQPNLIWTLVYLCWVQMIESEIMLILSFLIIAVPVANP